LGFIEVLVIMFNDSRLFWLIKPEKKLASNRIY
jgi:hypothetical protein